MPRKLLLGLGIAVLLALAAGPLGLLDAGPRQMSYSEFKTALRDGRIEEVRVSGDRISGRLKGEIGPAGFVTFRVDPELATELERYGVDFSGASVSGDGWNGVFSSLLIFGGFAALWIWLMRRAAAGARGGGSPLAIGKNKARIYAEREVPVRFDDVAGVDEAKEELDEIVSFLRDPASYGRLGARMPRGILLVGPPGTGKTLLARAVAGEASVPFFSISGSEFVEMFVGVGAARVRDLFEQARNQAPCIIFIDELDALGRARGAPGLSGGHDEKEQTLNQLLVELDGFDPSTAIVLLGATNRPEVLDPALLRAGRFDRQVLVDRPDRLGREQILKIYLERVRVGTRVDARQIAELTPGFTGADLANLVNEAALVATRTRRETVDMIDFETALERMIAGLEKKNRVINPAERRAVAFHEMGHAIVASALDVDPVRKISIIPRGIGALGYTMQRPTEDRFLMTRRELEDKLAVLMGGRAAEEIAIGEVSTGAADDLSRASDIARSMVTRYAMSPEMGPAAYESERNRFLTQTAVEIEPRRYSEQTAREIDTAVRALLERAIERARSTIENNRSVLDDGTKILLDTETLTGAQLDALMERVGVERRAA